MNSTVARKKFVTERPIRTVNNAVLRSARSITVSLGRSPGSFAVYLETDSGERWRISNDLPFRMADDLKERYRQRRHHLNQATLSS